MIVKVGMGACVHANFNAGGRRRGCPQGTVAVCATHEHRNVIPGSVYLVHEYLRADVERDQGYAHVLEVGLQAPSNHASIPRSPAD